MKDVQPLCRVWFNPGENQKKWMEQMPIVRNEVDVTKLNRHAVLPYELRLEDFQMAMQDVYDFFFDVNSHLTAKGLQRLDDMLRPAIMSGVILRTC